MWGASVKTKTFYNTPSGQWRRGKRPQSISLLEVSGTPFTGPYSRKRHAIETGKFQCNFNTLKAWSYDWWCMMRPSKDGKILFRNTCGYSAQTAIHHEMLNNILTLEQPELFGIKVVKIDCRAGLQNLEGAISNLIHEHGKLELKNSRARKVAKTGRRRFYWQRTSEDIRAEIKKVQFIQKSVGEKITRVLERDFKAAFEDAKQRHETHLIWKRRGAELKRERQKELEALPNIIVQRGTHALCEQLGVSSIIIPKIQAELLGLGEWCFDLENSTDEAATVDFNRPANVITFRGAK